MNLDIPQLTWRDRYLIRFKQPPSIQLEQFINQEIALAVQKDRDRMKRPPPLPDTRG